MNQQNEFISPNSFYKIRSKTKFRFFDYFNKICFFHDISFISIQYDNYTWTLMLTKKNINVMIYHSKQISSNYSFRIMIESIMFFNKRITNFKSRYWSIELKFVDLIWILRKTKYMIEFVFLFSIIYIDHETTIEINKQIFFRFRSQTNWIFV